MRCEWAPAAPSSPISTGKGIPEYTNIILLHASLATCTEVASWLICTIRLFQLFSSLFPSLFRSFPFQLGDRGRNVPKMPISLTISEFELVSFFCLLRGFLKLGRQGA
ncbi:hypothetical protein AAC387_Pa11g1875 [Persea americana]